jgi:hypothetical protein
MQNIQHLPPEEQQHFIQCDCGAYIDMRNLSEVFAHQHNNLPEPQWSHSVKKGAAFAYTKNGNELPLN